jgi:hypothetical protein
VVSGRLDTFFRQCRVDSQGNIYVVGEQKGTGEYGYGNETILRGTSKRPNAVLVKYSSTGVAQWLKTVTEGVTLSTFEGLALDSGDNVYAVGTIVGSEKYGFGNGVSANGGSTGINPVLVKYDSSGQALWSATTEGSSGECDFNGVAADSKGDIYVVGSQQGMGSCVYGSGVNGTWSSEGSALLVKYNNSGRAMWAKTVSSSKGKVQYWAVAVDSSDHVYVSGDQTGTGVANYGSNITESGSSSGSNATLAKYDSNGQVVWVRTSNSGAGESSFTGVAVDSSDNVFVVGSQHGAEIHKYGDSVSVPSSTDGTIGIVVRYNAEGDALWARASTKATGESFFYSVATDQDGNCYAVGDPKGTGDYEYGSSLLTKGNSPGENALILEYSSTGEPVADRVTGDCSLPSFFSGVALAMDHSLYAVGAQKGMENHTYGKTSIIAGSSKGWNSVLVRFRL